MQYHFSHTTEPVVKELVTAITDALKAGKKVLWLVSGGSGAKVSVEVAKQLVEHNLTNLSVTLSDERYGPLGHPDENWNILESLGFSIPGANTYRPLTGGSRGETTRAFNSWLKSTVDEADEVIALFGVGADGHTAGIKPRTPSITSTDFAADFEGEDFERITITPVFISHITHGVAQIFGKEKHSVVQQLLQETLPIDDQPAQLLKTIPTITIYSDYKETI